MTPLIIAIVLVSINTFGQLAFLGLIAYHLTSLSNPLWFFVVGMAVSLIALGFTIAGHSEKTVSNRLYLSIGLNAIMWVTLTTLH